MSQPQSLNPSPFSDAVVVSKDSCEAMVVGNAYLTASEASIYKRVEKTFEENVALKKLLQHNSTRMKKHYDHCLNWKNEFLRREDDLKTRLAHEEKEVELLKTKLKSYDEHLNEGGLTQRNILLKELEKLCDQLDKSMPTQESSDQNDVIIVNQAVQETKAVISDFEKQKFPDTHAFEEFRSKLYSINESYNSIQSEKFDSVTDILGKIQELFRQHSLVPVKPPQQITFSQYIDLKTKYDLALVANQQNEMKLEDYQDVDAKNEKLDEECKAAHLKIRELIKELKEKSDHIRSMEFKKENESFELPVTVAATLPMKKIEEENRKLKNEVERMKEELRETNDSFSKIVERMKEELRETNDSFNKIDDQNTILAEKIEQLEADNQVLNEKLTFYTNAQTTKISTEEFQQQVPSLQSNTSYESIAVVDQRDVKLGELEEEVESLNAQLLQLKTEKEELVKKNDELLKATILENEASKKLKIKHESQIGRFKKRENKDNDKINKLKEDKEEMRQHIEQLQKVLNKKTEKDNEIESLELQSMQFVDVCDSIDDTVTSFNDSTTLQANHIDSADEAPSLECDPGTIDELIKNLHEAENEKAALKIQFNDQKEKMEKELKLKEESIQQLLKDNNELDLQVQDLERQIPCSREVSLGADSDTREKKLRKTMTSKISITLLQERLTEQRKEFEAKFASLETLERTLKEKETENKELFNVQKIMQDDLNRLLTEYKSQGEQMVVQAQSFENTQRVLDQYKRDYENLWHSYEPLARMKKEYESQQSQNIEHVDKLTAEVFGSRDLIEQKNEEIKTLHKKIQAYDMEVKNMKDDLESIPILKVQMDVYQNDFNAERESREKLQTELNTLKDRLNHLSLDNHNMKEQLRIYGSQPLRNFQNRHHATDYQQHNRPTQGGYDRNQPGHSTTGGGMGGYNPQLYGRGGENRTDQEQMGDLEQRTCPKCDLNCPDVDTLQIHLMECIK